MSLTDRLLFVFLTFCLLAMAIPYIFDLGQGNIFLNDFYAKRIMTAVFLPFYLYIYIFSFLTQKSILSQNLIFYVIGLIILVFISILNSNRLSFIITDLFITTLPVCFYLLVYKTDFQIKSFTSFFPYLLLIACLITCFNIKLQFSYFSLLIVGYVIFITKKNLVTFLLLLLLPVILLYSLIGKSSLILLMIIVSYFVFFDKKFVSFSKKAFLFTIPLAIIILSAVVFWNQIKLTGAYTNTLYFISNADFLALDFKDHSTSHRLFEAMQVIKEFNNSSILNKIFGNGFGASIDLSQTIDATIGKANNDLENSRVIHMGFFAVLYKFGLFGLFGYFLLIRRIYISSKVLFKYSINSTLVLCALYLVMIVFDSFISFSHMMSNFMFWLIFFIVTKESRNILTDKKLIYE